MPDQDRWQAAATRSVGGKPKRGFARPLRVLKIHRQELLEAGYQRYQLPIAVTVSEDDVVGWPEGEWPHEPPGLIQAGVQLGGKGVEVTWVEAYLAGAFGRQGVEDNLDMIVTIALEAEASKLWIENNVERPAVEKITAVFGRKRGKPPLTDQDAMDRADTRRRRMAARKTRGEPLLEKHLGSDWRFVVFHGVSPIDEITDDMRTQYWKEVSDGD